MKTTALVLAALLVSFLPVASAGAPVPPVPVGVCAGLDRCSDGAEVCAGAFHWVPQCVDVCDGCIAVSPLPDVPPLVGVCIAGQTHPSCYRDGAICVSVSQMVPFCIEKQD